MAQKTLKKLALIVAASALCAGVFSCQKDADEKGGFTTGGDGSITFGVAFGNPSQDLTVKGSFELKDDAGNAIAMMEEATFDTPSPEQTKATLVNDLTGFGTTFQVSGFQGTAAYQEISNLAVTKQNEKYPDGTHEWTLSSPTSWPVGTDTNLEFFAWTPVDEAVEAGKFTPNKTGSINFSYTVDNALTQPDLMFAHYYGNGRDNTLGASNAPVAGVATMNFTHALSSVTFKADKSNPKLKGIKLNSITLENIGSTASCTASFGASTTYAWGTASTPLTYTTTFDSPIDLFVDGLTPCEDGTTFIVIPQTFGNGSDARIVLNITCEGVKYNISYKLADDSRTTTWEAGKTTVYIIKYGDVGVSIADEISDANVKQNLVIKNDGGVKEYIRAAIVANWCDSEGLILAPWTDASPTGFTDFPGTDWLPGTDGYYYYKKTVAPTGSPATLFKEYTPPVSPVEGAHLEMTIATQAVVWDESLTNVKSSWGEYAASLLNTN